MDRLNPQENLKNSVSYGALCLMLVVLAGCGGGGGSSKSGGGTSPVIVTSNNGADNSDDSGTTFTAADFETAEYNRQYGLRQMGASAAYAEGATGGGVTVAVIDTGIDLDHPDLAGQISDLSVDIVGGTRNDVNDTNGHGTAVAGVIAARKNSSGTHGVAFDAQVMAIRADDIDLGQCGGDGCDFFSSDTIAGINYAVANGARVINLSISGPDAIGADYRNALNNAGNKGVVVIAAAGNSGNVGPENPAAFAADSRSVGNMLAVGSVDSGGDISSFSNTAGTSASHFVVAAGERVRTLNDGGGEVLASGTSFATPHVAGAAAALIDLFPSLTAKQVVDLLRTTAVDLGAAGDDAVYGKGLVDLAAAVAPQGDTQVPQGDTVSGSSQSLSGSGAQFAASFGDGPAQAASAGGLHQVLFLDDYKRGYHADLRGLVGTRASATSLESFVVDGFDRHHAALDLTALSSPFGFADAAVYAFDEAKRSNQTQLAYLSATSLLDEKAAPGLSLTGGMSLGPWLGRVDFRLTQGDGMSVAGAASKTLQDAGTTNMFGMSQSLLTPLSDMADEGFAVGAQWQLSSHFRFDLSHMGDDAGSNLFADGERQMTTAGFSFTTGSENKRRAVSFELGNLREQNGLLGSVGAGAFGLASDSETVTGTVSGYYDVQTPLFDKVTLFGRYTMAQSDTADARGSLFSDWGRTTADGFAFGAMTEDVLRRNDRIGFVIGQPLRVQDAQATLRVPKTRNVQGQILYETQSVNLAPNGREISLELSYKTPLIRSNLPDGTLSFSLFGRREPGHIADADADIGLAGRIALPF